MSLPPSTETGGLRSFRITDGTGKELIPSALSDTITITRDDGMTIEISARRTDGYVAIYSGRHTLAVWPRGANVIYVTEEK